MLRNKLTIVFVLFALSTFAVTAFIVHKRLQITISQTNEDTEVLGTSSNKLPIVSLLNLTGNSTKKTTPSPTIQYASPKPAEYSIALIDGPKEISDEAEGTFTWDISGPSKIIHKTTIYYDTKSYPGTLLKSVRPEDTTYSRTLKNFLQGDLAIPLRFVESTFLPQAGTYYYRAYAEIDAKHYWTDEKSFVVKPAPKHAIHFIDKPTELAVNDTATFTWDIAGPNAATGFTAIVGGKESKPGTLNTSTNLPMTPYTVLINDFTNGNYTVPLRFVGNLTITQPGIYYFRGLSFINNKNIWSDEYSFVVE